MITGSRASRARAGDTAKGRLRCRLALFVASFRRDLGSCRRRRRRTERVTFRAGHHVIAPAAFCRVVIPSRSRTARALVTVARLAAPHLEPASALGLGRLLERATIALPKDQIPCGRAPGTAGRKRRRPVHHGDGRMAAPG
jgi:hypothetical protein